MQHLSSLLTGRSDEAKKFYLISSKILLPHIEDSKKQSAKRPGETPVFFWSHAYVENYPLFYSLSPKSTPHPMKCLRVIVSSILRKLR